MYGLRFYWLCIAGWLKILLEGIRTLLEGLNTLAEGKNILLEDVNALLEALNIFLFILKCKLIQEYCNRFGCDLQSLGGWCPVLCEFVVRVSSGQSRPGNLFGLLEEEGNIILRKVGSIRPLTQCHICRKTAVTTLNLSGPLPGQTDVRVSWRRYVKANAMHCSVQQGT